MSESDLTITYVELKQYVGEYLGYGRTSGNWSTSQLAGINRAIERGYRQFINPPVLPNDLAAHEWKFMKPTATIVTVADDYDYDLPDNVGYITSNLSYSANSGLWTIIAVDENFINEKRQSFASSSRPSHFAVAPLDDTANGQRFKLLLWPTPDDVYTLTYMYSQIQNKLSDTNLYPVGGEIHSETILQSCLAAAERLLKRNETTEWNHFMTLLRSSIIRDRQFGGPKHIGVMGDGGSRQSSSSQSYSVDYVGPLYN